MAPRHRLLLYIFEIALLAVVLAGCGNGADQPVSITLADTSCKAGQAQLAMGDSSQQILCGCTETSKKPVPAGTALLCTIPSGTTVFFHYQATMVSHQIMPSGTPAIPTSPLSDPSDSALVTVHLHVFKLIAPGTYQYHDALNGALNGSLIVQ